MKIFFITARFPYPLYKGDQSRAYNQIKQLSKNHEIILLSYIEQHEIKYIDKLSPFCKEIHTVPISRPEGLIRAGLSLFTTRPAQVAYYTTTKMKKTIIQLLEHRTFDHIHVQLIRMNECLPKNLKTPVTLDMIDAIQLNLQRRLIYSKGTLNPLVWLEWKKVKSYENKVSNLHNATIIISEKDKAALKSSNPNKIFTLPIGINHSYFKFNNQQTSKENPKLIFVGNMGYFPNVDAVSYFCKEVFPLLRNKIPTIEFYIVGINPAKKVKELEKIPGIHVTGFVKDIRPYLHSSSIFVCPLRAGAGIQFKVLEAMSVGIPIVASSVANEGLFTTPGKDILIAETEDEFIEHIINLLHSPNLAKQLTTNARKLIEKEYDWEKLSTNLEQIYTFAELNKKQI